MVKELISTLEEVQEDAFTQPLQSMLAVYVISAPRSPFVLAAVERRKERHVVVVRAGVAFPPNEFVADFCGSSIVLCLSSTKHASMQRGRGEGRDCIRCPIFLLGLFQMC